MKINLGMIKDGLNDATDFEVSSIDDDDGKDFEADHRSSPRRSDSALSLFFDANSFGMECIPLDIEKRQTNSSILPSSASNPTPPSAQPLDLSYTLDPIQLCEHYQPEPWDVLWGRGEKYFDHVGNRRLRILIACHLWSYMHVKHRLDRSKILKKVVSAVYDSGGRFLRQDSATGDWEIVTGTLVIRKVCHVINHSWGRSSGNAELSLDEKIAAVQDYLVYSSLHSRKNLARRTSARGRLVVA